MFSFLYQNSQGEKNEMKRNRGEIGRDGKNRGHFLIPSNKHLKELLWVSFLLWQNKLLPIPLKLELQKTLVIFYSTKALGCASVEIILT